MYVGACSAAAWCCSFAAKRSISAWITNACKIDELGVLCECMVHGAWCMVHGRVCVCGKTPAYRGSRASRQGGIWEMRQGWRG